MTPEETTLVGAVAGSIGALLGAVIGSVTTYCITRLNLQHQFEVKSAELGSVAELKRRELLFNAYQQRIQRIGDRGKEMGAAFGQIAGTLTGIDDEAEKRQINEAMFTLVKESFEVRREWFRELEEERDKVGLANTSPTQIEIIRRALSVNFDDTVPVDTKRMFIDFAKTLALMDALWQEVLEKKSEDLFSKGIGSQSLVAGSNQRA
ncbi:MAG: hypothetical protein QOH51_3861 [Acidobacteriota bacterium]|jgi:hypothetical protein|nr:hypothetical protein [Acidobacteriota bacterium]